jgi:tRNA A-37 threonylcarbamoyl transferase component Bud32/membrane-associated phospholipid phosphatase
MQRRRQRLKGIMDTTTDQTARVAERASGPVSVQRLRRRRRPSGEAPPLPRHLETTGIGWLLAAVALVALSVVTFTASRHAAAVVVTAADGAVVHWLAGLRSPWLTQALEGVALAAGWMGTKILVLCVVVLLLVFKRLRHLVVFVVAIESTFFLAVILASLLRRPRPFGVVIEGGWNGYALPSIEVAILAVTLVGVLYSLVPKGRWRQLGKLVATGIVALVGTAHVYLGVDAPTDVLIGVALGVTIPLLAYRWFTPDEVFPVRYRKGRAAHLDVGGERGAAIRRVLQDQLGLVVEEVEPFGLAGSAGSTPLRIKVQGDPDAWLFGKLYARGHLRSDRWYKLGRELLYGRLEDEKAFNSVRRLVQQEDYALHKLFLAGLPTSRPYGFVELTPDREYLLVTEFFDGATELGDAEVDQAVIDDGLGVIRKLWDAGLAHRDIKPANLLVRDGRVLVIDVAFVEAQPSPWRQAVDLANMMLCLALRSSPEQVYRSALRLFTVEEITEAFAATRGLTMPSQLRRLIRAQGHDLHADFLRLLPERPRPIVIQRWSARRVGLAALVVLVAFVLFNNALSLFIRDEGLVNSPILARELPCVPDEPLLLLMAQSVPTAALVPCTKDLPPGWTVAHVVVGDGMSRFKLDSDRGGGTALEVTLTGSCDLAGAREVPITDQPATRLFERIDRTRPGYAATRWYQFPGGCITQRLDASHGTRTQLVTDRALALGVTTRDALRTALRLDSDGRLELDAPAG